MAQPTLRSENGHSTGFTSDHVPPPCVKTIQTSPTPVISAPATLGPSRASAVAATSSQNRQNSDHSGVLRKFHSLMADPVMVPTKRMANSSSGNRPSAQATI
ncbi:hypothetical protein D3C86_1441730 [compost metagenome]